MTKKLIALIVILAVAVSVFAGCSSTASGSAASAASESAASGAVSNAAGTSQAASQAANANNAGKKHTYYYVAPLMAHPYVYDMHLGFKYAAQKFGCEIVKAGPDGFDTNASIQAFDETIAKKPDGIVTVVWDPAMIPSIKKAMAAGIPVVDVEANSADMGALTYIGLDNYQCGVDTANKLIELAGKSGNLVIQGNWGATNTEAKLKGITDTLASTQWKVVTKVDDKADTQTSIAGAKSAFNNFKDINAYLGIDSSSGPGIGAAMEELGIKPGSITVITHDREDATMEYVQKGYIQCSIANKTATETYMAIGLLEMYLNNSFDKVPISSDNVKAGIDSVMPDFCYTGTVNITKDNVELYMHDKMDTYDTDLYH